MSVASGLKSSICVSTRTPSALDLGCIIAGRRSGAPQCSMAWHDIAQHSTAWRQGTAQAGACTHVRPAAAHPAGEQDTIAKHASTASRVRAAPTLASVLSNSTKPMPLSSPLSRSVGSRTLTTVPYWPNASVSWLRTSSSPADKEGNKGQVAGQVRGSPPADAGGGSTEGRGVRQVRQAEQLRSTASNSAAAVYHSPRDESKPLTKMVVPSEAANRFSPGVPAQHAEQAQRGSVSGGLGRCMFGAAVQARGDGDGKGR